MSKQYSPNNLPIIMMMLSGGTAACIAQLITIPLDTAKVRMQIQAGIPKYTGMVHTIKTMIIEEGLASLYKGLVPGFHRQMVFASLRIGLYEPVKMLLVGENHQNKPISIFTRITAALMTGAFGIIVANPTDVVKIRFQGEGKKPLHQRRYKSVFNAYKTIIQTQGLRGLWTGIGPNIIRNSIINAAQIATFDQIKSMILRAKLMKDEVPCHLLSSSIAGFTACVIGSPVDVLKTRIMNAKEGQYNGILDCVIKTFKQGPLAFYKGFQANAWRIMSWNIMMFVSLGLIRKHIYSNFYSSKSQ